MDRGLENPFSGLGNQIGASKEAPILLLWKKHSDLSFPSTVNASQATDALADVRIAIITDAAGTTYSDIQFIMNPEVDISGPADGNGRRF